MKTWSVRMFKTFDNKKDYVLLLRADEFLRDRSIMAAAKSFDGMIVGMHKNPALLHNRMFDHVLIGDPHSEDDALQAVIAFEQSTGMKPAAVVPITEMTLRSASVIAQHYGIRFLSDESVASARDKLLMKEAFISHQVSTPEYRQFSSFEELEKACDEIQYPVIVKPSEAAHSVGVKLVESASELKQAYNYCVDGAAGSSSEWGYDANKLQVEKYIESMQEVSVEVVNFESKHQVIAITDKSLTPKPFFAEIGHLVPSLDTDNEALRQLAVDACASLNLTHGVSHVEIRIDEEGTPFVIEVAARPGGDGIMDLVERAYGVNMYELHIRSYLGSLNKDTFDRQYEPLGTAAIAFMPAQEGVIQSVNSTLKLPDEVVNLYLNKQPRRCG